MLPLLNKLKSDESLMLAYQQGNVRAFEELYRRHKDGLFGFLYRSHVDLVAIEELAQETWMAVVNAAEHYRPSAKFRTFLYSIAHRKLVDLWRKNNVDVDAEQVVEEVAAEKQPHEQMDMAIDLLLALETLSKEQQQAYLLREEGFSRSEIAVMMETSEETIKSRLRYASNHLKRLLEVHYAR